MDKPWSSFTIARQVIDAGEKRKFTFTGERSFEGAFIDFALFVARGVRPGPTLGITAVIHGDEINSAEIARRVFAQIKTEDLAGTLVILPAVNSLGFRTMNRYLPDRRDLNRFFPGSVNGSVAGLIAHAVFSEVIRHCSHLVDLHTGSNFRTNMPQIRVDTSVAEALDMAQHFGVGVIIPGEGPPGSLRRAAVDAGIPAILYEAGPPYVFMEPDIRQGVAGIQNVMAGLGMTTKKTAHATPSTMLRKSHWIRVPRGRGGIYLPLVEIGNSVTDGQVLGTVTDPITDIETQIRARRDGIVIGMALPQVVLSGYALFHVGELETAR